MTLIEDNLTLAYNIGLHIHKLIDADPNVNTFNKKHFSNGTNPYFNQMEEGIMLEEYYGMPAKLYTKIGEWNITGSGSSKNNGWKNIIDQLKVDLGLELQKEGEKHHNMGYFGPYWNITKLNGENILSAKKRTKRDYINYAECKKIWGKFQNNINIKVI